MGSRRQLTTATVALGAAFTLAACAWLPGANSPVKRMYVKDYQLIVGARSIGGTSSKDFEDAKSLVIKNLGSVGLTYSPNYIFVAEPELLLGLTSPVEFPPGSTVEEPTGFTSTGELATQTVLRKPIFLINKTTLTYSVPGYTIQPVVLTQQLPVKSNEYHLKLTGTAQVNELMAAFAANPAKTAAISGTVTAAVEIQDLDPLASEKTFTVSRSLPLSYNYQPFTPETTASAAPPQIVVVTPTPGPTPTATPTAVAPASPTSPPTATPIPTPTPIATP